MNRDGPTAGAHPRGTRGTSLRATAVPKPGRAAVGVLGLVLVASGAAAAAALLSGRLAGALPRSLGTATTLAVDRWVELGVVAAGAGAAVWIALSSGLALVCVGLAALGRTWHAGEAVLRRTAPTAVHRLTRVALGVGVGAGLALVPTAAQAADGPAGPDPRTDVVTFDLGWQATPSADPVRPSGPTAPEAARPSGASPLAADGGVVGRPGGERVVVQRGDTLWGIAATALGAHASDADVLREVVRWHDANRHVIGHDPDVILPGQVLRAPA